MDREILFKVWDKKAKRMSIPFSLFGEFTLMGGVHSWPFESGVEGDQIGRLNDLIQLQYTGFRDIKRTKEYPEGQPIFEGDIVETENKAGEKFIDAVKWENDLLGFRIGECHFFDDCKIIGNIFQHKHLLK